MYFKLISGKHRIGKKKYVPGDIIENDAQLDEIFDNKFEEVEKPSRKRADSDKKEKEAPVKKEDLVGLEIQHKGGGRYNVLNAETGEPINDEYLTKKEANELAGVK